MLTWALLLIHSLSLGKPLILASVFLYEMHVVLVYFIEFFMFNLHFLKYLASLNEDLFRNTKISKSPR